MYAVSFHILTSDPRKGIETKWQKYSGYRLQQDGISRVSIQALAMLRVL